MDWIETVRMLAGATMQSGVTLKSAVKTDDGLINLTIDAHSIDGTSSVRVAGKMFDYDCDFESQISPDAVDFSINQSVVDQFKIELAKAGDAMTGLYAVMPKDQQNAMDALLKAVATGRGSWVADGKPHTVFVVPNVAP